MEQPVTQDIPVDGLLAVEVVIKVLNQDLEV
jgi:hypothetical protein